MAERALPALDKDNMAFWTGGNEGGLLIEKCGDCGYLVHPPCGFCPACESRQVAPTPVSGFGRIAALTVNVQQWHPGLEVPYAVALVELEEQADVRLVSNIVACDPYAARIGMRVRVTFEQVEELAIPLFAPCAEGAA